MTPKQRLDDATRAKLLLVLCGICWGLMWPLITIGLSGLSPWSFRLIGFTVGALALMVVVKLSGRSLAVPGGMTWVHLFVSSILNVVTFGVFSTFAMLTTSTGRVAVVSYSFPVWACLLAWLILGEKLRGAVALGLALCIGGLAVLLYPVIGSAGADRARAFARLRDDLGHRDDLSQAGQNSRRHDRQHGLADRHRGRRAAVLHPDLPGLADVRARARQRRWPQ